MKTLNVFIIFLIVAIIQIYVPSKMIYDQTDILMSGEPFKFRTEPIDPTDPFRGKYITLNYELDQYKTNRSDWKNGEEIFIYLKKDDSGYASIDTIVKDIIKNKKHYIKSNVSYYSYNILYFDLEFERFYMEETKAPRAEIAYINVNRDSLSTNTYSLVYVKEGGAVLENVFIDDIPIAEYVDK